MLMHRQFVVTQTDILALVDSWFTKTPFVKILCPQIIDCPYIYVETKHASFLACWGLVEFFSLSLKFPGLKTQLIICVLSYFVSNTSGILLIRKMLDGRRIKEDVGGEKKSWPNLG
jgi:hypothetical protein